MLAFRNLFIAVFLIFLAGCGSKYENIKTLADVNSPGEKEIAIMPFESPADDTQNAGMAMADTLAGLFMADGFTVIEPEEVAQKVASMDDYISIPKLGHLLDVPYIMAGRVTEYTYKAGVGESPVIGLNARLIDVAKGKVIWTATMTDSSNGNWFVENTLSRLSAKMGDRIVRSVNGMFVK